MAALASADRLSDRDGYGNRGHGGSDHEQDDQLVVLVGKKAAQGPVEAGGIYAGQDHQHRPPHDVRDAPTLAVSLVLPESPG
jgi:hypothetical protein